MSPSATTRDKKITASQKRLEKAQTDKADLLAKIEALDAHIALERRHLEWVKAMPVDDEDPAQARTKPPATGM